MSGRPAAERYLEIENESDPEDERLRAPPAKEEADDDDDEGVKTDAGAVLELVKAISDVKDIEYDATKNDTAKGDDKIDSNDNDDGEEMLARSQDNQKNSAATMPIVFLLAFRHLFHGFFKQNTRRFRRNNKKPSATPASGENGDSFQFHDATTTSGTGNGLGIDWDLDNIEIPDIESDNEDDSEGSDDTGEHRTSTAAASVSTDSIESSHWRPKSKGKRRAIARRLRLRGTKSRGLQLLKSRSGSSDYNDPATRRSQTMSNLSGRADLDDEVSTEADAALKGNSNEASMHSFLAGLPANPDPYANRMNGDCNGSAASDSFCISYHDDDDTLDNVSYAFSDDIGVVESRDVGSITDGMASEIRVTVSDGDGNEDDVISFLGDEDEAEGSCAPSDEDAVDDNVVSTTGSENKSDALTHFRQPAIDDEDEYEDIRPLFKHRALRDAAEMQTSYDFAVQHDERDDIGSTERMPLVNKAGYDLVDL